MIKAYCYEDTEFDYSDCCEGAELDCPYCGSDAIQTDAGTVCSNPNCPSNQ